MSKSEKYLTEKQIRARLAAIRQRFESAGTIDSSDILWMLNRIDALLVEVDELHTEIHDLHEYM